MMTMEDRAMEAREWAAGHPQWKWDEGEGSLRNGDAIGRPVVALSGGGWYAWWSGFLVGGRHHTVESAMRSLGYETE